MLCPGSSSSSEASVVEHFRDYVLNMDFPFFVCVCDKNLEHPQEIQVIAGRKSSPHTDRKPPVWFETTFLLLTQQC